MTNTLEPHEVADHPNPDTSRSATSLLEGSGEPSEDGTGIVGLVLLVGGLLFLGFQFGWNILWVIGALLGMIFLHELGHFVTAKWAGMQVTQFFLFFGPRIWSFRRGETEYGIRAIPLGAFVKITGMSNVEPVDPAIESRTYRQKSYLRRMSVAVAGSTMHFLLALGLIFALLVTEGPLWDDAGPPPVVGSLSAEGGALAAGVQPGDVIVSVDGVDIPLWDDLGPTISDLGSKTVPVVVDRGGELIELTATFGERLTEEGANAIDGALTGERILALEGQPLSSFAEFVALTAGREGEQIEVTLDLLTEEPLTTNIEITGRLVDGATRGFFGVGLDPDADTVDSIGVGSALARTIPEFGQLLWSSTKAIATTLWPPNLFGMFADAIAPSADVNIGPLDLQRLEEFEQIDPNRLLSPVGAVNVGNQAFNAGWASFGLFFLSINMFIGVFNLTPMLPFDGGHVIIGTYEAIRSRMKGVRHFADVTKLLPLTYGVFAVLLGIFVLGLYLDISNPITF